ncbi:unnamed protein product [Lota lota]
MSTGAPLCILLLLSIPDLRMQAEDYGDYEDGESLCSTEETIRGGHVSYSQGGLKGSVLTYHCSHGYDPFPVSHRLCDDDGEWSTMTSANGRLLTRATCKEKLCPGQLQLDNGDFSPRDQWFRPGTMQSFSCFGGLTLSGSANRTCTLSLEWTGTGPICDNNVGTCKDPGVPPGALRSGSRFKVGDTVTYRCQAGMDLLGSSQRVCLYSREWSGSPPRCQAYNGFDSPSVVAALLTGSLAGVMESHSPEIQESGECPGFGRTIDVEDDSRLNIYILLDTSGSVATYFDDTRKAAISLIRKLDSFDVQMKFHVTSFASKAIDIVTIAETYISTDAQLVIESIQDFDPNVHKGNTGTNLFEGLRRVDAMMAVLKESGEDNSFMETQNVIVIITDGNSNTGHSPMVALTRIRSHFNYSPTSTDNDHTKEKLLDVYVFGIGKEINRKNLNEIASKKQKEEHVFILEDLKALGTVFNSMINIKTVTKCGVAEEETSNDLPKDTSITRPWHVALKVLATDLSAEIPCYGSVVSPSWILTAAHCFARSSVAALRQNIEVKHGWCRNSEMMDGTIFIHPKFNVKGLEHRNVSEFYDFDLALVQLNTSIPLSWGARPVCLPCTTAADRAMKRVGSTCKQHRNELLPHNQNVASFINRKSERVETLVHIGEQRQACVSKAAGLLKEPTDVTLDELVPERFLCTGGSATFKNSVSCKGDSGGSLFLRNRMRYFQVGVLSWGTVDLCGSRADRLPAADARDFYISLFTVVPWLKQHLGQQLAFLPLED